MATLDEALCLLPDTIGRLKADGIHESVLLERNDDVDFSYNAVLRIRTTY